MKVWQTSHERKHKITGLKNSPRKVVHGFRTCVELHNSLRKVVHGNVELCRVRVDQSERSMWHAHIEESGDDRIKGVETIVSRRWRR